MTAAPSWIRALLLLLAGALVVHLFMLSDVGASHGERHAGMDTAIAGVGGMQTSLEAESSDGEPQELGHAMAVACLAVLAAAVVLVWLQRALAHGEALTVGRFCASTSTVLVRDLWPPPRGESSRVDGGVLLLI